MQSEKKKPKKNLDNGGSVIQICPVNSTRVKIYTPLTVRQSYLAHSLWISHIKNITFLKPMKATESFYK